MQWRTGQVGEGQKDTCIFVMAKHPTVGMVKTRLGKSLGHEKVAHLYLCFLRDTVEKLKCIDVPFFIYYTPYDKGVDFVRLFGDDLVYVPQMGDSLGERLHHGFKVSFERGFSSAIALASDVPDLPESVLGEALEALKDFDSVIGPSFDGGYYLIGLVDGVARKNLFQGITWSTEAVFAETMNKLEEEKVSCHTLTQWSDVDLVEDLEWLSSSRDPFFHGSHTWKYLRDSGII